MIHALTDLLHEPPAPQGRALRRRSRLRAVPGRLFSRWEGRRGHVPSGAAPRAGEGVTDDERPV